MPSFKCMKIINRLALTLIQFTSMTMILAPISVAAAESSNHSNSSNSLMFIVENELQCLTQMPVADLLKIRKTLDALHIVSNSVDEQRPGSSVKRKFDEKVNNENVNGDGDGDGGSVLLRELIDVKSNGMQYPSAAPFMATGGMRGNHFKHKVGYPDAWEDEKPTKIQKILHFSITALTFLAFAGYLLCMIVQAIKSKGTTYYHPAFLPMVSPGQPSPNRLASTVQQRPTRFRRQATTAKNSTQRPRFSLAEPDPNNLYKALLMAAEGYVRLNEIQSAIKEYY